MQPGLRLNVGQPKCLTSFAVCTSAHEVPSADRRHRNHMRTSEVKTEAKENAATVGAFLISTVDMSDSLECNKWVINMQCSMHLK